MDGAWNPPSFPNAERRAAGNAKRTHAALEPVGQTFSKTGGAHGQEQTRPESNSVRGAVTRKFHRGSLDSEPMANRNRGKR
jgi:hypothetical protein